MTTRQFTAPHAKLRAAQRHGKTFGEELQKYVEAHKNCVKFITKPPSTDRVLVATLAPMPEDLSVILGEIAQQIRSALAILPVGLEPPVQRMFISQSQKPKTDIWTSVPGTKSKN